MISLSIYLSMIVLISFQVSFDGGEEFFFHEGKHLAHSCYLFLSCRLLLFQKTMNAQFIVDLFQLFDVVDESNEASHASVLSVDFVLEVD